ncbi:hypothetical protein ACH5RR_015620 [Cinchona calisaya]|uniref:Uncharacterized protein n=1 Tax=Cinchona calisaya TaxID=153742 RepID=A0ABD2ZTP6_9GENT
MAVQQVLQQPSCLWNSPLNFVINVALGHLLGRLIPFYHIELPRSALNSEQSLDEDLPKSSTSLISACFVQLDLSIFVGGLEVAISLIKSEEKSEVGHRIIDTKLRPLGIAEKMCQKQRDKLPNGEGRISGHADCRLIQTWL